MRFDDRKWNPTQFDFELPAEIPPNRIEPTQELFSLLVCSLFLNTNPNPFGERPKREIRGAMRWWQHERKRKQMKWNRILSHPVRSAHFESNRICALDIRRRWPPPLQPKKTFGSLWRSFSFSFYLFNFCCALFIPSRFRSLPTFRRFPWLLDSIFDFRFRCLFHFFNKKFLDWRIAKGQTLLCSRHTLLLLGAAVSKLVRKVEKEERRGREKKKWNSKWNRIKLCEWNEIKQEKKYRR